MRRFLLGLLLWLLAVPVFAQPRMTILLLPGTSLSDWRRADAPALHHLLTAGAVGLMNTRTARLPSDHVRETPDSAALTLGAGARAAGQPASFAPPDAPCLPGATAGQVYQRRMGRPPPPNSRVCPDWPRIQAANAGLGYALSLGALADALAAHGVRMTPRGGPMADLLAARGDGTVWTGASDITVIDCGADLTAADREIARAMAAGETTLVVSPSASDADYRAGNRLCPIGFWRPGIAPGLLASRSTRRPGLVTDTDFAPTVAAEYGVPMPLAFGAAWTNQADAAPLLRLTAIQDTARAQWAGLKLLPPTAIILAVLILVGSLRGWAWLGAAPWAWALALWIAHSPGSFWLALAAVSLTAIVLRHRAVPVFATILTLGLLGDALLGGLWMPHCPLGYSWIEGARYYGLGNEAMGPLIAGTMLLACRAWGRVPRGLVIGALVLAVVLLGSPMAGAKAGGMIVGTTAFGSLVIGLTGRRLPWNAVMGLAVLGLGLLIGMAMLDFGHSHFGQALARFRSGGASEALALAGRKLAVEGHLLTHSVWAVLLGVSLLGVFRLRAASPVLANAALAAAGVTLLVNDAGAVAAALMLSLVWGSLVQETQQRPQREIPSAGAAAVA